MEPNISVEAPQVTQTPAVSSRSQTTPQKPKLFTRLFQGKNKFITLGITILIIAAAITLPILITSTNSDTPTTPEQQRVASQQEVANIVNNVPEDISDENLSGILSDLDTRAEAAPTDQDRIFYIKAKANAYNRSGNTLDAIEVLKSIIDELRDLKEWPVLTTTYASLGFYYAQLGQNSVAIEWYEAAIAVIDEITPDPDDPNVIDGRDFYSSQIRALSI